MQKTETEKTVPELIKQFSVKPVTYDTSSLIDSMKGLRSYTPLPSELREKNSYVERFAKEWFSQRMRKYDELSPEIFEIKRGIEISSKYFKDSDGHSCGNEKASLEIPMLLQAELDKDEGWKKECSHHSTYDRYKLSLFSRIPKVPFDVRKAGKEALAFAYKTYGEALTTEILGDTIMEHPEYVPHPENAKLIVLWKPKPSEIHIEAKRIENDPALILNWSKPYLVSTWKEPDEEPFMHLISACMIPIGLDGFLADSEQKNQKGENDLKRREG
jgi:hypothetical protein